MLLYKFDMVMDDIMPQFFWDNYENKSHARELMVYYRAMEPILKTELKGKAGSPWHQFLDHRRDIAKACEALHEKYHERHLKFYIFKKKKINGNVNWPMMNKTEAMKEFLAMGFKHREDVKPDLTMGYYVYAHTCCDLWYPEVFDSHQDAIKVQTTLGISGYTGTTLKKEK